MTPENTPERRREIAVEVNSRTPKGRKGNRPNWINSTDELIAQYRDYVYAESMERHLTEESGETEQRHARMLSEMTAELSTAQFEYHLPALLFLFRRYLTQR